MTIIVPPKEIPTEKKSGRFREREVHICNWSANKDLICLDCSTILKHPYRCEDCRIELAIILEN